MTSSLRLSELHACCLPFRARTADLTGPWLDRAASSGAVGARSEICDRMFSPFVVVVAGIVPVAFIRCYSEWSLPTDFVPCSQHSLGSTMPRASFLGA